MKHIFKLLKKYSIGILAVIILLVMQAYCDLALPEYTSNIISIGIQQKGIENGVLDYMSETTFDNLNAITFNDDLSDYYDFVEKGNVSYTSEFEEVKTNNMYLLKTTLTDEEKDKLNDILLAPETFLVMISQQSDMEINANTLEYMLTINENEADETSLAMQKMYAGVQNIDSNLLKQYAATFVYQEYNKIHIDTESIQMNYLCKSGTKMVLFAVFIMFVIILTAYLSGIIASSFAYDLRSKVVNQVMDYSQAEYNKFSKASLITRSTNDISQIQQLLTMLLRMVLYAPIVGIGAIFKVIHINMAWVIGIAVALILILVIILLVVALPKFKLVQKLIDRINQIVREQLNGLPVIRAFANEEEEKKRFDVANKDLYKVNLFTHKVMAFMMPCMTLIMNGIIVLIYWVGVSKIDTGTIQIGTLTALISYTMQIIMSFLMLSMISIMAPRAIISINRISEVLNTKSSIKEKEHPTKFDESKKGLVEFNHVSFKYPDGQDLVLDDLNFKIYPGTTTAIIGSTGSGKSSIVNLIPRFFDVTEGEILVDGVNIKDASLKDLRSIIGVVPQKGLLFSGTVRSNIKFANEKMSDEEMKKAADIACASEFIEKLEGKYDYAINQGGTNVSGGQRQRLAIARAVAANPEIFIFDDSFSALDYKTDSIVRHNLNESCAFATKIIVAQRVATVMNADQIIVIDQGKIVGIGTHKELYKTCKTYQEIALSQLKEEELV